MLIFPHQLFDQHPGRAEQPDHTVLIEDPLFFGDPQYPMRFHKQKLWLHRTSMTRYAERLRTEGETVDYVDYDVGEPVTQQTIADLSKAGFTRLVCADPVDFSLEKRLKAYAKEAEIELEILETPGFLNSKADNRNWRATQKRWFMVEFYKAQRRRLNVLMQGDAPMGGQWSFDEDNRKKVPKKLLST
ncbi:MAG: cryptochrome/photolyase family protein, partial [Pseudomonadota bacterium]